MSDYIEIPLTQGKFALINAEDFELVSQFKWTLSSNPYKGRTINYARRTVKESDKQKTIYLHRFLLNAPKGMQVDHRNGDGLDNRQVNLRIATQSQNRCNSYQAKTNKFGFRGIGQQKNGRFYARVTHCRKQIELGTFNTPEEAARAYDKKAIELFGEFACLNFPVKQPESSICPNCVFNFDDKLTEKYCDLHYAEMMECEAAAAYHEAFAA